MNGFFTPAQAEHMTIGEFEHYYERGLFAPMPQGEELRGLRRKIYQRMVMMGTYERKR